MPNLCQGAQCTILLLFQSERNFLLHYIIGLMILSCQSVIMVQITSQYYMTSLSMAQLLYLYIVWHYLYCFPCDSKTAFMYIQT